MQGSEQGCTRAFTLAQGPPNTLCKSSASSVPALAYNLGAWPCREHLKPGRSADGDLPWRRKAVYWSSISQAFLEQLKQHKHFADMSCVSTSGPGQAPPGSAEGLGHTGSREVSPWPSSRLPAQAVPQLWDRDAAAVTRNPEPSLSREAALHGVRSGSTPAISTTPWGQKSCLGQAGKVY